jgi:hypothetical protein
MAIKYSDSLNLAFKNTSTTRTRIKSNINKYKFLMAKTNTNLFDTKNMIFVRYTLSDRLDFEMYNCNSFLSTKILSEHARNTEIDNLKIEETFISDSIHIFIKKSNELLNNHSYGHVIFKLSSLLLSYSDRLSDFLLSDINDEHNIIIEDCDTQLRKILTKTLYIKISLLMAIYHSSYNLVVFLHDLMIKYNLHFDNSYLNFFTVSILHDDEILTDSLVDNVIDDSIDIIRNKIIKLGYLLKFLDLKFPNYLNNYMNRLDITQKLLCNLLLCDDNKNYNLYKTYHSHNNGFSRLKHDYKKFCRYILIKSLSCPKIIKSNEMFNHRIQLAFAIIGCACGCVALPGMIILKEKIYDRLITVMLFFAVSASTLFICANCALLYDLIYELVRSRVKLPKDAGKQISMERIANEINF